MKNLKPSQLWQERRKELRQKAQRVVSELPRWKFNTLLFAYAAVVINGIDGKWFWAVIFAISAVMMTGCEIWDFQLRHKPVGDAEEGQ